MRVLVTGSAGFVGRHLATELTNAGHELILTDLAPNELATSHVALDICNYKNCYDVLNRFKPEAIIHLAGIAQTTGINHEALDAINVQGTLNLAMAYCEVLKTANRDHGLFLFISSAFVYGGSQKTGTLYCNENTPVDPRGDYGFSKLKAEAELLKIKDSSFKLYIARPFNHIGPGQSKNFVLPGLASRFKEAPEHSPISTGNLDSVRDFTDVRDVVRAYRLILEKTPKEQIFVVASGTPHRIRSIFDKLNSLSGKYLKPQEDSQLLRNEGEAILLGDVLLAEKALGWKPTISIEQSISDVWNEYK